MIVDLKTTQDAGPKFAQSVAKFGYHTQAAFYKDGMAYGEKKNCGFTIIAVEKTPPYAVGVYVMDGEAVEQGRKNYKRVLTRWAKSVQSGNYPGYSVAPETLSLPDWAIEHEPLTV
jgi:exodeoxyribonuclease VIII